MDSLNGNDKPRVVILLGPTGVGKSKLAMELAEEFGGEIVGADSMQVYRYMDIGTAKPTPEEQQRIRHHLIDLVMPNQPFHAGLYRTLCRKIIDQLYRNGRHIWVVGGTGLYIKALTGGLFDSPEIDPAVRERLRGEAEEKGEESLYDRLKEVDPKTASTLHPRDLFRTIRALEVFDSTGLPISFLRDKHQFREKPYHTLKIGLQMDRSTLYQRIEERVDRMIERGFLTEVRKLLDMGYAPHLKPMQGLGYKEMIRFLSKEIGWTEAVREMKKETRRYAKRQWTWFRADREVCWREISSDRQKTCLEISSFLERGG